LRHDHRRVAGFAILIGEPDGALPDRFASGLVERDHRGLRSTRGHDYAVAIDQRRLAVVPVAVSAAEVLYQVSMPYSLPVLVDADDISLLTDRIDSVAVQGWGAA